MTKIHQGIGIWTCRILIVLNLSLCVLSRELSSNLIPSKRYDDSIAGKDFGQAFRFGGGSSGFRFVKKSGGESLLQELTEIKFNIARLLRALEEEEEPSPPLSKRSGDMDEDLLNVRPVREGRRYLLWRKITG
ncbi:unnamed protein product [Lepeophtheirus salmonis]|uniref:(salmon louse) hypothetical protein n=1 Tax=Lepeophtheirus salmonis TaxID=72036 RepID=A0A0K2T4P0_LEPSM|nr:uncharacterized protein LOC121124199 [Lepeophtheirus salmonis]CAB4070459.1 unnamed protein product [Lepeophtheirus salmonis]CAF3046179.1 unnamed protein product [Lepeophtheirus salmonis]